MEGKIIVIGIFGESCTGKSTLAAKIAKKITCEIFTGKDYLRLAKNENIARMQFQKKLANAVRGNHIIYVISENEHLNLLPDGTLRILVTAELDQIKARFTQRMHGTLPTPVATMLEKRHGCFDHVPHDFHVNTTNTNLEEILAKIK